MMKLKIYKKQILVSFIFLVLVGAITVITFSNAASSLANHATDVVKKCAEEDYRPACYDVEIPKLMDGGISMEDAYSVTQLVQKQDESYFYCHTLGHNLGAKETAKDPFKWQEVVARTPSGMCSNGGMHGAFQERYRLESLPNAEIQELKPILKDICYEKENWDPTKLEQATCTHAVGHLTMYVTEGDIYRSLTLCKEVSINERGYNFIQLCYDGAFMQIFQPQEPEDFAIVEGKQPTIDTIDTYCEQFIGEQYGSCRSESWPLYGEKIKTSDGISQICSPIKDSRLQSRCYSAMFYVVTASRLELNPERIEDFCIQFPQERKDQCFANAASRMIETDWNKIPDAISLCTVAEKHNAQEECYKELLLYSTYNFHHKSKEFFELCNGLPQSWKKECLNQ